MRECARLGRWSLKPMHDREDQGSCGDQHTNAGRGKIKTIWRKVKYMILDSCETKLIKKAQKVLITPVGADILSHSAR